MPGDVRNSVNYIEAALTVPRHINDAVCNFIIENYSSGLILEEEDKSNQVGIKFHVPESDGDGFLTELAAYVNRLMPETSFRANNITTRIIKNVEWEDAYRQSVKPTLVDNVVIRPPWVSGDFKNKLEIIIEPKMAFGTGSHETTRLCIREILSHFKPDQTFFDLGCGSGILSILAAKLGAKIAKGVDTDLMSIQNARENIEINGVQKNMVVESGSIEQAADDPPYDFLAANLIKSTILELYEKIHAAVRPGGIIVLSGLLPEDEGNIVNMLNDYDILKYDIKQDAHWLAITVVTK